MSKKFVWLGVTSYDRNKNFLEKGETYDVKDFPEARVKEWIRTKNAELVESKKSEKGGNE